MSEKPIRVLIVDDSALVRRVLRQLLSSAPDIEIVAAAADGAEAVALTESLRPDIITMDVMMPGVSGYEAVEQIMAHCPTPILVLSSVVDPNDKTAAGPLLAAGALEVMAKPALHSGTAGAQARDELIRKIRLLSKVRVITHVRGRQQGGQRAGNSSPPPNGSGGSGSERRLVAIAASTGGPYAVRQVLQQLPSDFPVPIILVQHIAYGFAQGLADWFDKITPLTVRLGQTGDPLTAATVLVAPEGAHMLVGADERIVLSDAPPVHSLRPSADLAFASVARVFGAKAVGVILTGMGQDGAVGMKAMREAGAWTIAQDEASCTIYGMPRAAMEMGAACEEVALEKIAERLVALCAPAHDGVS